MSVINLLQEYLVIFCTKDKYEIYFSFPQNTLESQIDVLPDYTGKIDVSLLQTVYHKFLSSLNFLSLKSRAMTILTLKYHDY